MRKGRPKGPVQVSMPLGVLVPDGSKMIGPGPILPGSHRRARVSRSFLVFSLFFFC